METLFEHEVKLDPPKLSKLDIRMLSMLEIKIFSSRNDKLEIFQTN